ncbi:pentatricopeptide repeat-containing protein At3g53360, mitochondrial-like isoform X2 [Selaginella moellendorffii]|uniref:pentatricopeptide repeat-containing protein At3g53360, mitochondrial-like isoform X2 n=1 Tax=Selaginella moellendorffii TaxID=88036 RepID=UPI000D1C2B96|nr:pentatricopeptide repeat-containing protein At3g53360, mitochondrial-like isoform X2 [Selaginella moellendorffii]|eukprot:XP_024540347.1 pentatricopeptide repeat-containing protein At3g53360, mitochondrial-like isoform X2 [Selaginella moellendorffii]
MRRIARQCAIAKTALSIPGASRIEEPSAFPRPGYSTSEHSSEFLDESLASTRTKTKSSTKSTARKELDSREHSNGLSARTGSQKHERKCAFMAGLKSCSASKDVEKGRKIHRDAIDAGHESDLFVATALVDMYANCGSMVEARKVFDNMLHRDVVSWNALILGYVENGNSEEALRLFDAMQASKRCSPSSRTFVAVLMAYTHQATRNQARQLEFLESGMALYSRAGSHANNFVAAALVALCAKCGGMQQARKVFDTVARPDVSLWNVYILGYVENGENDEALRLFYRMQLEPNARTVMAALLACGNLAAQEEGIRIDGMNLKVEALRQGVAVHSVARRHGCDSHNFVGNCLIDMYSRCGSVVEARRVFDSMSSKTVITWTAMMVGYELNSEAELALELFSQMRSGPEACEPDERAVVAALTACASLAGKETGQLIDGKQLVKVESLEKGMAIHSRSRSMDIFIATSLIDMYAKCGSLEDARRVFDAMAHHDVASWNVLITGHAEGGESERALEFYDRMQAQGICAPNATTLVAALTACIDIAAKEEGNTDESGKGVRSSCLERGTALHRQGKQLDCESDMSVANALLEMYARCGRLEELWVVFHSMPCRNVSAWTALILGHVENGEAKAALELFERMQVEDQCSPKVWTFSCAFRACLMLLDLRAGKVLHAAACRRGLEDSLTLETLLMDFYGKCGKAPQAQHVFDSRLTRDSLSWNSLISCYSLQGDSERVFELFYQMLLDHESVAVTAATFVSVLTTCSHAGLVDDGKKFFHSMRSRHGMEPGLEHYNCMVDMLGRANRFDEAVEMVKTMPHEATALTWRTLLSACQTWKNVEVGKLAFEALVKLDESDSAGYVLMSNIYSAADEDSTFGKEEKVISEAKLLIFQSLVPLQFYPSHPFLFREQFFDFGVAKFELNGV